MHSQPVKYDKSLVLGVRGIERLVWMNRSSMRKNWLDDKLGGDKDELVIAMEEFGDDEWCSTPGPIMPMRA